jgi:hypothetical protein
MLTVKEDVSTIKSSISVVKERWEQSELHERMLHNARLLKNNVFDRLLYPIRHN